MKRIAVYCGSNTGIKPVYREECLKLAAGLCSRRIGLVYGGGNIGLMGIIADEMLRLRGEVIGVIPQKMVDIELAHTGLTELHIVGSMHERKALMAQLSDGFIALPGGIGTLDELFEVFTWRQLGYHHKPLGILNVDGYYDLLLLFLKTISADGFLKKEQLEALVIRGNSAELIEAMDR